MIKEIAILELEVAHLEQYLLSLYRQAFDQQVTSLSPSAKDERLKSPSTTPRGRIPEVYRPDVSSKRENFAVTSGQTLTNSLKESNVFGEESVLDSGVHRCHSSLSQRTAFFSKTSPPAESFARAVRACHSQPLSMMEVN